MRINRSSMYAAFGDKEALFHKVMERYRAGRMSHIRQALAQLSLREVVAGLLFGTAEFPRPQAILAAAFRSKGRWHVAQMRNL